MIFMYNGFLPFVSNHPIVLGPNNTNLPKIFSIIAEGEMHEAIKHEDPCAKRLANVVRQVQVSHFGYTGEEEPQELWFWFWFVFSSSSLSEEGNTNPSS